jgi:hypothetical protein
VESSVDEFFAAKAASNDQVICIGPLSRAEAPEAVEAGLGNGAGIYVYLMRSSDRGQSVDVLAKVASQEAAETLSRLLGFDASKQD